jgi:hypothetical protein
VTGAPYALQSRRYALRRLKLDDEVNGADVYSKLE